MVIPLSPALSSPPGSRCLRARRPGCRAIERSVLFPKGRPSSAQLLRSNHSGPPTGEPASRLRSSHNGGRPEEINRCHAMPGPEWSEAGPLFALANGTLWRLIRIFDLDYDFLIWGVGSPASSAASPGYSSPAPRIGLLRGAFEFCKARVDVFDFNRLGRVIENGLCRADTYGGGCVRVHHGLQQRGGRRAVPCCRRATAWPTASRRASRYAARNSGSFIQRSRVLVRQFRQCAPLPQCSSE